MAPPQYDTTRDRLQSLQDSTFLPLPWRVRAAAWRGQHSGKCQLPTAPLFLTLAVITMANAIWALATTEVTLMTREQELALFLSQNMAHLIATALGSCRLPSMLKWLQVKVAICSFTGWFHSHGTVIRTWQTTTWSYCNLLSSTPNAVAHGHGQRRRTAFLAPRHPTPSHLLLCPVQMHDTRFPNAASLCHLLRELHSQEQCS